MTIDEAISKIISDPQTVLRRFSDDKELMDMFILKFPKEKSLLAFRESCKTKNWGDIEVDIHTLKGIAGNLGIETVFNSSAELVKSIRAGTEDESIALIPKVLKDIDEVCAIIAQVE